ncbi:MAG TPA: hypothetical protein VHH88_07345, partial [Verrucomicrobiae bacterium]|nr:hypothetical protein [Verrucomicrobiae bacterium]
GDSEGFGALLPDGKAWAGEFYYQRGTPMFNNYKGPALDLGGKWIRGQNGAQPGRDWKDFALIDWFVFGIRSNGTLWVSEKASPWNQPQRLTNSLRQVGGDTDWQAVAVASYPAVLLKTDGTLWRWGEPAYTKLDRSHPFASAPALLPFGSDWRKVIPGESGDSTAYAWKNDGSAWLLGFERSKGGHCTMEPLRAFDGLEWKERPATLTFLFDRGLLRRFQIGVRSDGSLWWWEGSSSGKASTEVKDLRQIGTDTNWVSVLHGGRDFILVGLKTDGTLWKWSPFKFRRGYASFAPDIPPKRLGRNNDWLAIHQSYQGVFALAADGTLWFWWERDGPQPLLAPPRRPVFLASIFSGAK